MAQHATGGEHHEHGPARHALIHWLTGVVFASILALCLIFLGPATPGLEAHLREVEAKGVDAAMRARLVNAPAPGPSQAAPGYVFLDIDTDACRRFGARSRCDTRSPAAPGLAADVAAAVLAAHPRVVMLDVSLWDQDRGDPPPEPSFQRLAAAARANPGARVIAVAPFRPDGPAGHGVIDWSLLPPELASGEIVYAPAFVWQGARDADGVIRSYPADALVQDAARPGPAQPTPSLPNLAALYAKAGSSGVAQIDCRFGALIRAAPCARRLPAPPRAEEGERRMLYVLPSLVPEREDVRVPEASRFQAIYDRYPVSRAFSNGALALPPELIADRVVVISTSAETGLDRHDTPLGDMAGAEVLLNAFNAFATDAFVREPNTSRRLGEEALTILLSSTPFLLFWLGYFRLAPRLRKGRIGAAALPFLASAGFVAAVAAAMAIAALLILGGLRQGFQQGFALEFFTPIFALSLEGFAEGARWVLERIEHLCERLVGVLAKRSSKRVKKEA
jgi:CHASE2 domain-containing sensor protein